MLDDELQRIRANIDANIAMMIGIDLNLELHSHHALGHVGDRLHAAQDTRHGPMLRNFLQEYDLYALNTLWGECGVHAITRIPWNRPKHEGRQIDYILSSKSIRNRIDTVDLLEDVSLTASDHIMLRAQVEMNIPSKYYQAPP